MGSGTSLVILIFALFVVVRTLDFESFAIGLPQEEPLRVVLKKPVRRPFRGCSFHTILLRHGGPGALRFRKMTGVDACPFVRDDDYVARDYQVKTPSGAARVRHGAGAHWSRGAPSDQQVWDSPGYRESRYGAGGLPVYDYRGRTKDGVHWRMLALFMEAAAYQTKDATAAAVLDRLLDSACVDVSRLPH